MATLRWRNRQFHTVKQDSKIFSLKVAGLETALGTEHNWAMMLSLSLIPALTQYLVLPFCPESPRYLLINRGEERKAEAGRCLSMTGCMMLVLVSELVTSWTVRQRETRLPHHQG